MCFGTSVPRAYWRKPPKTTIDWGGNGVEGTRVLTLGEEKGNTLVGQDTLLHREALLVVTTCKESVIMGESIS